MLLNCSRWLFTQPPSTPFKSIRSVSFASSSSKPRIGSLGALDDYHGVKIAHPYRWLEDPDSEETKEFVQKQVELTQSVPKECVREGSDWVTIKVMRVEDGRVEPETSSWVKVSGISWRHDNKGFFYSRYPAPKEGEDIDAGTEANANLHHELYYHFMGTDQSKDILCWKDSENPKYLFGASVTDDGKVLLL